jgi:hypothetical protein
LLIGICSFSGAIFWGWKPHFHNLPFSDRLPAKANYVVQPGNNKNQAQEKSQNVNHRTSTA